MQRDAADVGCVYVCMSCAKMANSVEMPFAMQADISLRNCVSDEGPRL